MKRSPLIALIISVALMLIVRNIDPENKILFGVCLVAWFISLFVVAYVSTPSNSMYGKIAFVSMVVAMIGIAFKILQFTDHANVIITVGLVGVVGAYGIMWFKGNADS
jgi:hypothetical protein